ncbi:MAG: hypothetical protein FKY71_06460 [Spiribacter salinus]|uniref:Uncharacterized protein n=1 Tax=Spiribacter salinus TaxID=1335746 RepID=A0A540VSW9_9GAMM|nr:MAG: hypothetical protein FKY71_06460 [Spiribacter salinus]
MNVERPDDEGITGATPRPDEEMEEEVTPLPDGLYAQPDANIPDEPLGHGANEALVVRDSVGNVVKTVEQLPASIGRGSECTVCLDGAGAVGIYARLRRNIGDGVMLEKIRPDVELVSHGVSGDIHELANGDYFSVDGHVFAIDWPKVDARETKASPSGRIKPKYVVMGILAMAAFLFALGGFMQMRAPEVSGTPERAQSEESESESGSGSIVVDQSETEATDTESATDDQPSRTVMRPLWTLDAMLDAAVGETDETGRAGGNPAPDDDEIDIETVDVAPGDSADADDTAAVDEDSGTNTTRIGAESRERGMALYHDGSAAEAVQTMRTTANRSDMAGSADARGLNWLANRVEDAVDLSANAREDLANDRVMEAGEQLARLGRMERNTLTPGGLSRYYRELEAALAGAIRERMVSAKRSDDARESYRWADMLLDFRKDEEAANVIAALDETARERYDYAFELEMIDVGNATRVWREVVSLVPAESPWHQRAVAKIRQYHPNSE